MAWTRGARMPLLLLLLRFVCRAAGTEEEEQQQQNNERCHYPAAAVPRPRCRLGGAEGNGQTQKRESARTGACVGVMDGAIAGRQRLLRKCKPRHFVFSRALRADHLK
jgi:hypothetical protein